MRMERGARKCTNNDRQLVTAMSKFSDDEAERICTEARQILSRPVARHEVREEREDCVRGDPPAADRPEPPVESRNARHRRELDEQERKFAVERRKRQRETDAEIARQQVGHLEQQLTEIVATTSTAIEGLEHEVSRVTAENSALKVKLAQLEVVVAELRLDRRAVIDLPNPLRAVN
jgi:hypothetical protein